MKPATAETEKFSIHTKLHRSKTAHKARLFAGWFSIHTKLHRSKTISISIFSSSAFSIHTKLHRSKTHLHNNRAF